MAHEITEPRNSNHAMVKKHTLDAGVGGRHSNPPCPGDRGGYQDICNKMEVSIQDLKKILHHPVLIRAAEKIGADSFVSMWRMVDQLQDDGIWLRLPSFSRLERFKRNEMIMRMSDDGFSSEDIRRHLVSVDIHLTSRSIQLILAQNRTSDG